MSEMSEDAKRWERYRRVVEAALANARFTKDELREACADERSVFITRVVKLLEQDGNLGIEAAESQPTYRWICDRETFACAQWVDSKIYTDRIKRTPQMERPRERLLKYGAENLKLAELLAILVRTGRTGESALQAGEKLAGRFHDRLERLPKAGRGELAGISSVVGESVYCQIMAGIELGRRVADAIEQSQERITPIRGSQDARSFCMRHFRRMAIDEAQEEFHVVTLNTKNEVIATHQISRGLLDQTVVHPREVFHAAIRDSAKSVILVHNHPSGDPDPSEKDIALTRRFDSAGEMLGIQVLDHIVVAARGSVSIREHMADHR